MRPRIRFNWRKGTSSAQLILKSTFPAVSLIMIIIIVIYSSNTRVKQQLSAQFFENSSQTTFRAINHVYEPLLNTLKVSSLWVQLGQITELENLESYSGNIKSLIAGDGKIQSLSLMDKNGIVLDLIRNGKEEVLFNETTVEDGRSLIHLRNDNGLSYSNLYEDLFQTERTGGKISPLKLSHSYSLPYLEEVGITIYYRLYANKDEYLELWLDFSLKKLAALMSEYSLNRESVIFILLDDDEFVSYPMAELMKWQGLPELSHNPDSLEIIQKIYNHVQNNDNKNSDMARISLEDESWWIHYSKLNMLDSNIIIGSYTPESTLLISKIQNPLIIASSIFLIMIAIYLYFLFDDYKKVLKEQLMTTEEEKVKRLIAMSENLYCEFKSSLRWDYREESANKALETVIMKSISAFSNSDGGTLLIGVQDDGKILGLENDYSCMKERGKDYFELHLRTLLSNMFGVAYPVSHIKVDFPVVDGIEICRIKIRKGEYPLYLKGNEKGSGKTEKFYVRSGNSSRQISSISEITDYVMDRFR